MSSLRLHKGLLYAFFIALVFYLCSVSLLWAKKTVYFQGTDYELRVYHIRGRLKSRAVLIIGGIQGDEPGGYLSADSYADIALKKGDLIIIPRANLPSIIKNCKSINMSFTPSR